MGRVGREKKIPLSVFYLRYFAYIFLSALLLVAALVLLFNCLVATGALYPANYAEKQAQEAHDAIESAPQVTQELIPPLCDYAVFDLNGNQTDGSLTGKAAERAWEAVRQEKRSLGDYSYSVIARGAEYCVLRYALTVQFSSPRLREALPQPEVIFLGAAILGLLFIIVFVALRFGRALNGKLSALKSVTGKIEHQELDFDISPSGIREIDALLGSMDDMRLALKSSLEAQWRTEQEKSSQMSALAHDLKTPLTLVRGNAELLMEEELTEKQEKYARCIANSSLQMQNYVQTLIETTKSWQGGQFRAEKTACEPFFKEVEQQLTGLCAVYGLVPAWDCSCALTEITIDRELLLRAVINVLANAAERTPRGGTVKVSISADGGVLTLSVEDSGSGFTPAALRHATEQFYMDDAGRSSKTHFGVGLYAADTIVKKHGGALILQNSQDTGGAKVTIRIPAAH